MSYDDQYIAGTAYHCYNGDASAQTALHNAYPSKDIWFTECSRFHGPTDTYAKYFSDALNWQAQNIELGTTKNWAGGTSTDTTPPTVPANVAASGMTSTTYTFTVTARDAAGNTSAAANQQWQPVPLGGGLDKFVALNSGKCLDLRDLNIADGAWMQQWTCTGGPAQSFRLVQQP